jgi:hypothetical protein
VIVILLWPSRSLTIFTDGIRLMAIARSVGWRRLPLTNIWANVRAATVAKLETQRKEKRAALLKPNRPAFCCRVSQR